MDLFSCAAVDRELSDLLEKGKHREAEAMLCSHLDLLLDEDGSAHASLVDEQGQVIDSALAQFLLSRHPIAGIKIQGEHVN